MVGLPHRVWLLGAVAKDQLILIPERRGSVVRKSDQVRIESVHDAVDGAVGRGFPVAILYDAGDAPVKRGNGEPRLAKRHALDQFHQIGGCFVCAGIGTGLTG